MMERNHTLDVARAISMLYIIAFWHLLSYTELIKTVPFGDYVKNAALGTFIFISGFLLGQKYIIKDIRSLGHFMGRRVIRLMPLFIVSLLSYYFSGFITLKTTLFALTGISTFLPPQPPTLWFIAMLLIFYYLFPILSGRKQWVQILIALVVFILVFSFDNFHGGVDRRFFYYWPCFVLGVVLSKYPLEKFVKTWKTLGISIVVFFILSISFNQNLISLPQWLYRMLISASGVFMILSFSQLLSKGSFIIKAGSILSYLSMTAYLFHRQVLDVIEKFIYWPPDGWFRVVYLVLFCLPVIILVGYLVQKIYDMVLARTFEKGKRGN